MHGPLHVSDETDTSSSITTTPQLQHVDSYTSMLNISDDNGVESHCNLHIDNIPHTWTDTDLLQIFTPYGTVVRSRVVIDNVTGQSAGYAFVMYDTANSAQHAITTLNNAVFDNKQIRVTYKNKKSTTQSTPIAQSTVPVTSVLSSINTNLYIAGLPTIYTLSDLNDIFSMFGTIVESRILHDRTNGLQRNVAFVRYDSIDSCYAAITTWHNKPITALPSNNEQTYVEANSKQNLTVRFAVDKQQSLMYTNPRNLSNLSLASMDSVTTLPYINTGHNSYDSTCTSMIPTEQLTSPTQPFLPLSLPPPPPSQPATLFVCHLACTVTDADLYYLFSPYGILHSVAVMRDLATGQSKGYGFINYINVVDAQVAIDALNGVIVHDKSIQISFKKQSYHHTGRKNMHSPSYSTWSTPTWQQPYNPVYFSPSLIS